MTPEAKVKAAVVATLKKYDDVYYFFPAMGVYGKSGVPDVIACYKGFFIAIECKAGRNECTPLQMNALSSIQDAGGTAIIVRETKETQAQLKSIMDWMKLNG